MELFELYKLSTNLNQFIKDSETEVHHVDTKVTTKKVEKSRQEKIIENVISKQPFHIYGSPSITRLQHVKPYKGMGVESEDE